MRKDEYMTVNELERIRAHYPIGTRIELTSMDDPYAPIQPGTRGSVAAIDDMGTLHMKWDNGRTLGVVPGVDQFRKLSMEEIADEKLDKYLSCLQNEVFPLVDFGYLQTSYENHDTEYPNEILGKMHSKLTEIYGRDKFDEDDCDVLLPAVIRQINGDKEYIGLVQLSLCDSGEHFGTILLIKDGALSSEWTDLSDEQKATWKDLGRYDYFYTGEIENDIHVDWRDCPDELFNRLESIRDQSSGGMQLT